MSDVACIAVPKARLDAVWPIAGPLLAKAVKTAAGKLLPEDVLDGARGDTYVIWLVFVDGAVVAALTTRIMEYPRCRAMAIDWVGGTRMREWIRPVLRVMKDHAERHQCAHMEGYGREAWMRWLGNDGWRPEYVAFKMEIGNG